MARVLIGNVRQPVEELLEFFAPAGYGLGTDILSKYITLEELDNTFVNGLYWVTCIGSMVDGQVYNYALARVSGNGTTHSIQELFPLGLNKVLIRRCYEGNWATEWDQLTWKSYADKSYAPAGYGLGSTTGKTVLWSEIDNAKEFGLWSIWGDEGTKTVSGLTFTYANMLVLPMDANAVTQILFPIGTKGLMLIRKSMDDTWQDWEWLDPPMSPGVEYLTTETWYGAPVYTALFETGTLNDAKNVVATNFTAKRVLRQCGYIESHCLPHIDGTLESENSVWVNALVYNGNIELTFHVGSALRGKGAAVQLWYIKV